VLAHWFTCAGYLGIFVCESVWQAASQTHLVVSLRTTGCKHHQNVPRMRMKALYTLMRCNIKHSLNINNQYNFIVYCGFLVKCMV